MSYSQKEVRNQKILLWITALPIFLSMTLPMMLNYVENVLFKPILY